MNRTVRSSYDEVVNGHQHYQQVVTINCVEGWNAKILWEGVLVKDLLQEAGASQNATVAIFHGSDGYTTALPINYMIQNNIMIAIQNEQLHPYRLR